MRASSKEGPHFSFLKTLSTYIPAGFVLCRELLYVEPATLEFESISFESVGLDMSSIGSSRKKQEM